MIRCAVFDFDGTLVDSNPVKIGSFYEAARPLDPEGRLVAEALARPDRGDRAEITAWLAERLAAQGRIGDAEVAATADALCRRYTRLCEEGIAACAEIPGAEAALRALSERGIPLFVNSGTPTEPLRRAVSGRGLAGRFRAVWGAPGTKVENLERCAAAAGAGPDEVLFVGDGEDDRAAAGRVGCHFVGISRPGSSGFAAPPERCLPDLTGLPELAAGLGAPPPRARAR